MLNAKERLELQNNSRYFIALVKVSKEFIAMCNENFDPFFINESGLKGRL